MALDAMTKIGGGKNPRDDRVWEDMCITTFANVPEVSVGGPTSVVAPTRYFDAES